MSFSFFASAPEGMCFGTSRVMFFAGLSLRSPWNTGWRIEPVAVHSEKLTSATRVGLTQ